MRDIPIIFSAPMVRAQLREVEAPGTGKTMTRRLAWTWTYRAKRTLHGSPGCVGTAKPSSWQKVRPGDRLYVRESHYRYGRWIKSGRTATGRQRWRFKAHVHNRVPHNNGPVLFPEEIRLADVAKKRTDAGWHLRPSIFLPRQFSRLTLVVTATKIERLQDISYADAVAEGLIRIEPRLDHSETEVTWQHSANGVRFDFAQSAFEDLWSSLHGPASWYADPEVVALTFTVHAANIDRMAKEAA